jgi:hypothetical protein
MLNVLDRLVSHSVEVPCWIKGLDLPCWVVVDRSGYSHYYRLAYSFFVGPVPPGLHLDHLCRRPECWNPWHLDPVTPRINSRRGWAAKKGRYFVPRPITSMPWLSRSAREWIEAGAPSIMIGQKES